jgi:signal transduction histidine kinase
MSAFVCVSLFSSRRRRSCYRWDCLAYNVRLKVNHQAVLTVRDFGRGVPAELLRGSQANGEHFGIGLSGMRERVNDLGGTFEIQSSGNGTLITVSIPVTRDII